MRKQPIKLSIDDPCHEDWDAMTPTQQGKFCTSCQKEVIDFTSLSDAEIVTRMQLSKGKDMCGQFNSTQLQRTMYPQAKDPSLFSLRAVMMGATLTSLVGLESCRRSKHVVGKFYIEQPVENRGGADRHEVETSGGIVLEEQETTKFTKQTISGIVIDQGTADPLKKAEVKVLDASGKTMGKTNTNRKGEFELSFELKGDEKLVFSHEGYTIQFMELEEWKQQTEQIVIMYRRVTTVKGRVLTAPPF